MTEHEIDKLFDKLDRIEKRLDKLERANAPDINTAGPARPLWPSSPHGMVWSSPMGASR